MSFLKKIIYTLSLVLLASCSGKSTSEVFFRDNLDLGYITTIAVMPFENNSKDKYATERLRDITITKILSLKNFDVVDKGIVDNQLKNEAISLSGDNLDIQTMERLGQLINSQALFLGTVDSSEEKRRGSVSYHQLTITLRLIDAATGTILWHATGSRNGDSFGSRILGVAPDDEFGVAFKLLDELIRTIPRRDDTQQQVLEPAIETEPEFTSEPGSDGEPEFIAEPESNDEPEFTSEPGSNDELDFGSEPGSDDELDFGSEPGLNDELDFTSEPESESLPLDETGNNFIDSDNETSP